MLIGQKSEKHELRFVRSHLGSNNPPLYVKGSVESRCTERCLFSIRPRQMIGKTREFSWEGLRASLSVSSFVYYRVGNHVSGTHVVRHVASKTLTGGKNYDRRRLPNPIVDANSDPRLNTNLQEDYPKKLFVFMQFVLHYLACHLSFVATLQNVRGCRKTNIYALASD